MKQCKNKKPSVDGTASVHSSEIARNSAEHPSLEPNIPAQEDTTPAIVCVPDGGVGWLYVACVFLINAHTWGINGVSVHPQSKLKILPIMITSSSPWTVLRNLSGPLSLTQYIFWCYPTWFRVRRRSLYFHVHAYSTTGDGVYTQVWDTEHIIDQLNFGDHCTPWGTAPWAKQIWQLFLSQDICLGWVKHIVDIDRVVLYNN